MRPSLPRRQRSSWLNVAAVGIATLVPIPAHASFLPPELMDTVAMYIAWFIIVVVPIIGIVVFLLVHVLPEKIAEKRHHPQKDAIQTLCLLSLVFGGLLWPLAWLWAFTKPAGYRLAYGTDKADHYFVEMAERAGKGELTGDQLRQLQAEFDNILARGALSPTLARARDKVIAAARTPAAAPMPPAPASVATSVPAATPASAPAAPAGPAGGEA